MPWLYPAMKSIFGLTKPLCRLYLPELRTRVPNTHGPGLILLEGFVEFRVADITSAGVKFDESLDIKWLQEIFSGDFLTPFLPLSSSQVTGRLRRLGAQVLVEASCSLSLEAPCSSCLEKFATRVAVNFMVTVDPAPGRSRQLPQEQELSPEDLDELFYHDGVLDLRDIIREQIILSLPMFPKCSDDCRGLCPVCGANLNKEQCSCGEGIVDPRWLALKSFKTT